MASLSSSDVDLLRMAEAEELFVLADALSARVNIYRNAFKELIAEIRLKFDATRFFSELRSAGGPAGPVIRSPL